MSNGRAEESVGERRSWVERHRSLSVLVGAAGLVSSAALMLWLHLATSTGSTSSGSPHVAAGDLLFFGLVSVLVVVAAILMLRRIHSPRFGA